MRGILGHGLVGPLDEHTLFEPGSGPELGDQVDSLRTTLRGRVRRTLTKSSLARTRTWTKTANSALMRH
jgi:hypothetical protein